MIGPPPLPGLIPPVKEKNLKGKYMLGSLPPPGVLSPGKRKNIKGKNYMIGSLSCRGH